MPQSLKRLLYSAYPYIALLSMVSLIVAALRSANEHDWLPKVATPIAVSIVGGVFAIQKQRLDELRHFYGLFRSFNERYDGLNDNLQRLLASSEAPTADQEHDVLDYFNLCSEEYFFFKSGSIPREVWRTWCRGMRDYLKDPRIESLWQREAGTDAYYGLSLEIIRRGAE